MWTLNLGILAHVDAGKTTLTERLLYAAGATQQIGSVDQGTTQTDTLALERERGITIRSAVASFAVGDLAVNIIDTPGHPDFIAEVERVLNVLDGALLVISAVEGVQSQTPLLMRALQRLRIPTLIFVNKIDRAGAEDARVLEAIARRLRVTTVPMGSVRCLAARDAVFVPATADDPAHRTQLIEALAERDDGLLRTFIEGADSDGAVSSGHLAQLLAVQARHAQVHPVFFGSAITGAGTDALIGGIRKLLPAANGDPHAPVSGRVFKIERGASREKVAYVRLFSGTLRARDRVRYGDGAEGKVTALVVFGPGGAVQRAVAAGEIGKLWGLPGVKVGEAIGELPPIGVEHRFPRPMLESVVDPRRPADAGRLRSALRELAEQDPLISVRQDDKRHEIAVSLYGEVQKEVIQETLLRDYGVAADFRETTTVHVERPTGTGEAVEVLRARTKTNVTGHSSPDSSNPFVATLGLRVTPATPDSGVELRLDVDVRLVPLYIYKTVEHFTEQMAAYVSDALEEGLFGWRMTDCTVTVIDCGYRAPGTGVGDYRRLTPLVLMQALEQAGTSVCEPMAAITVEVPSDSASALLTLLGRLDAHVEATDVQGGLATVEAVLAAASVQDVRRRLPGLSGGEGVLESRLAGYRTVAGTPPTRRRTRPDPLNREEYMMHVTRRV
jgi:ribosomal protection tetracycline resistance protein